MNLRTESYKITNILCLETGSLQSGYVAMLTEELLFHHSII